MKFKVEPWTISKLAERRDELLLSPRYQRGDAWKENKQALLVDTILMECDVPKLYFAKNRNGALYEFDVVDGQQRLRALYRFLGIDRDGKGKSLKLCKRYGLEWSDADTLTFDDLPEAEKRRFLDSEITVTVVSDATNDQLRRLFLRLQMGSVLNQAELRNALASRNGDHVNAIVDNHAFFKVTAIPFGRFKRQDYLAQAIVLTRSITANAICAVDAETAKDFYLDEELPMTFWGKVATVLDVMCAITTENPRAFYNKWMFVDFFAFFWVFDLNIKGDQAAKISKAIGKFEAERIIVRKEPEKLIGRKGREPKLLLGYVDAFYKDGGLAKNLEKRHNYIRTQRSNLMLE